MRRLDKTLADYVAIAISPALIMLMVGSLMWFLVAVFYEGRYAGRIYWILACFVFAIVLIARIAIEESRERASLFAIPLAAAVGVATMRFSDVMLLHWGLLALAWWSSEKLTWDCTLIDEEQDSSGQGLLQLVGLRKKPPDDGNGEGQTAEAQTEEPAEPEGVTQRVDRMREEAHPKRRTKGKGHAPGVWIVYFSLAALPLFGLGQILIPVSDGARRFWAFQLLCVYVAAGLGLLVTTSFLGLRRYLRQRGVQMPPQMAGVWIALGAGLIVALLAVCAILPRPAAEYEIAQLPDIPFKFTTPERESNRYAMGKEGADKNDPDSQSRTQGEQDGNKPEGGKSENPESGGKQGSNAKEGRGNEKGQDGKSQGNQQGRSEADKKSQQGDSGEKGQSGSESKSDNRHDDSRQSSSQQNDPDQDTSKGQPQDGERGESSNDRQDRGDRNQGSAESGRESERENSRRENADESERSRDEQNKQGRSEETQPDRRATQDPRGQSERRDEENRDEENEDEESSRSRQTREPSTGSRSQKPDSPPFQLPHVTMSGGILGMLKFLLFVVLACVGLWWLWRNRSAVMAGLRQILQELRDLWAALFGGTRKSGEEEGEDALPERRTDRPFSDYVDPFATGMAARYTPVELVRYTFEATEAWARENGCERDADQTPHEFAGRLGRRVKSLQSGALSLAKLYNQAAYAPGSLGAESLAPLADFWRRLRAAHGTVAQPPPVPAAAGE